MPGNTISHQPGQGVLRTICLVYQNLPVLAPDIYRRIVGEKTPRTPLDSSGAHHCTTEKAHAREKVAGRVGQGHLQTYDSHGGASAQGLELFFCVGVFADRCHQSVERLHMRRVLTTYSLLVHSSASVAIRGRGNCQHHAHHHG